MEGPSLGMSRAVTEIRALSSRNSTMGWQPSDGNTRKPNAHCNQFHEDDDPGSVSFLNDISHYSSTKELCFLLQILGATE